MSKLFKYIFLIFLNSFNIIVPKNKNSICVITYPDFDDTSKNLIRDSIAKKKKVTLLISKYTGGDLPYWSKDAHIYRKYSLKGIWSFLRSYYVFFTHNHYPGLRINNNQMIINLWHGMPIKDIGKFDKKAIIPKANFTIASCDYFQKYLSLAFDMPLNSILKLPHPRLKSLFNTDSKLKSKFVSENESFGIWLPTYRKTIMSESREDGDSKLDIIGIENINYSSLDEELIKRNVVIYVKPHPMNLKQVVPAALACKNIKFIDDDWLAKQNITLYEVLALSDFLITDISSVYFDYKVLNRKIIIAFCDKSKYIQSRCQNGKNFEEIVNEKVIYNQQELLDQIDTSMYTPNKEYIVFWEKEKIVNNFFDELNNAFEYDKK